MTSPEVEACLIQILHELQELSGRSTGELTNQTRPIGDLPDFDSLNGVEATVLAEERLGVEIRANNVFVRDNIVLCVAEAAERIMMAKEKVVE